MMRRAVPVVVVGILAVAAARAEAGTIYLGSGTSGGNDIAGQAEVTYDDGFLTITLTNLTPITYSADQLLTGFAFSIASAGGTASLTSATTPSGRTVGKTGKVSGTYSDSAGSVDLLGANTWNLDVASDDYRLVFNPDAAYGILGAPDASTGLYSSANGSIVNNGGHNPFANGSATFVISNSAFTTGTRITDVSFLWGTDLNSVTPVPLPPAVWLGMSLLGALGASRLRRSRRAR